MPREITYSQAINEAMCLEMERDETVVFFGEDVAGGHGTQGELDAWGGAHAVTGGMLAKFPGRVLDTPISELAITGAAAGAAATGLRPIVEIMFGDFLTLAADQLINQAAKFRYMFGGKVSTPMVLRTTYGAGQAAAAQHSQAFYAMVAAVPGLKVAVPATPYDAKGLLAEAIQLDDPVVFFENKVSYDLLRGDVPVERYTIPFGEADVVREGQDVTIVAIGRMREIALDAAELLSAEGVDCEVIDPRTLSPLDEDTIFDSVDNTGRLVVVDEANPFCGAAADIVARVCINCYDSLRAAPQIVTAPHAPVPMSPTLENLYIPDAQRVKAAALAVASEPLSKR